MGQRRSRLRRRQSAEHVRTHALGPDRPVYPPSFHTGDLTPEQLHALRLWIYYDDDCEVYLNGVKAFEAQGWTTRYGMQPINQAALDALQPQGDNVIAIHAHQNTGGQYIDAGLRYTRYTPVEDCTLSDLPARQPLPEVKATDSVYLMSYFKAGAQLLFYAYSRDGKQWTDINGSRPVFDAYDEQVWLRDPYLRRVTHNGKTRYHLVHTWGWDHPALFHWESDDLIHWTAANGGTHTDDGKIRLMDGHDGGPVSPNAWAPEFTYDPADSLFYLYWSSSIGGRQIHHYCTTKDWLTFSTPAVYFDPGFTAIDMTILHDGDTYYAYYKDERNGEKTIRCATSKSLDPKVQRFEGSTPLLPSKYIEVEGPEVFQAMGDKGWFLYFDKFNGDKGVSYSRCRDPSQNKWYPVPDGEIRNSTDVKHGSVEIILLDELNKILSYYK
ncbi:MAG: glycoside hydrolase family 43 protein [Paraprevotella sp.]|nr:glycoside hydrolase family 43 protein [Paraprevotella sp.]